MGPTCECVCYCQRGGLGAGQEQARTGTGVAAGLARPTLVVVLWGDGSFHQGWDVVDGQQLPPGSRGNLDGFLDGIINSWL